jgi:hypothetical protein
MMANTTSRTSNASQLYGQTVIIINASTDLGLSISTTLRKLASNIVLVTPDQPSLNKAAMEAYKVSPNPYCHEDVVQLSETGQEVEHPSIMARAVEGGFGTEQGETSLKLLFSDLVKFDHLVVVPSQDASDEGTVLPSPI